MKQSKQELIKNELRDDDDFKLPKNATVIDGYEADSNKLPNLKFYFNDYYTKSKDESEVHLEMRIDGKVALHNCTCHKLAAICFFEQDVEGKFKQVPLLASMPDLKYIVFGMVDELDVRE